MFETLVPDPRYPIWKQRSIRSLAAANDLYTSVSSNERPDAFELYLKNEIEEPALESLERAAQRAKLTSRDHERITRFAVALDQRTPDAFLENSTRWKKQIPGMLHSTLEGAKRKLERKALPTVANATQESRQFPLRVRIGKDAATGEGQIEAVITVGRELWLWAMRYALEVTAPKVIATGGIRWSVVEPRTGSEWFTSDHPLLRVNYYEPGRFDFGGGWGFKGSELALPLSPTALLYAKVGTQNQPFLTFDRSASLTMQYLLAMRAFQAIYSSQSDGRIESLRPRVVDRTAYSARRAELESWHQANLEAETR